MTCSTGGGMFTITGAAAGGLFLITGAAACGLSMTIGAAGGLFTITGVAAGGLFTIAGAVTDGLSSIAGDAGRDLMPVFRSTGRRFGKGGAGCGTATGMDTDARKTGGNTTAGAAGLDFGGGKRTDLAFNVLHFVNFAFVQSCRSMRFILFSISCSSEDACADC